MPYMTWDFPSAKALYVCFFSGVELEPGRSGTTWRMATNRSRPALAWRFLG